MKKFALTVLIALTGCATPYTADLTGKPTARVRVVSTHSYLVRASTLAGDCLPINLESWNLKTLQLAELPGRGSAPKRESIGMPMPNLPEYASFVERRIPAGAPFALGFFTAAPGRCSVGVRFTPREGGDYEARFAEDTEGCTIAFYGLVPSQDKAATPVQVDGVQRLRRC